MCKPNIPEDLRRTLEECGPETIRMILANGWANPEGIVKGITQPGSERNDAIRWLKWKDAQRARREIFIFIAAIFAIPGAIGAVAAAFFSGLPLFK
jgi:hypothetical protein